MVPFTWEEMRARFEPRMATEACDICSQIPLSSRDNFPDAWKRLENAGLPDTESFVRYRCPICHQLYHWSREIPWNSADPYNPDLAGEPYTTLYRMPVRTSFSELLFHRMADERFGRALAAIEPQLVPEIDQRRHLGNGSSFWAHHQCVCIECGDHRRWVVLSEQGDVTRSTLAELARIATIDLPEGLDHPGRVQAYAARVDEVTSEHAVVVVDRFEDIRWRKPLTDAERTSIEDLRLASRIEPERVEQLVDRTLVRRWVVAGHKLICRVLIVWPTGAVEREDAVIGDAIPL